MKTIKVGDLITFRYHDYDYTVNPLLVKKTTERIIVANPIIKGLLDNNDVKIVKGIAKKVTHKSFCVKEDRIASVEKCIRHGLRLPYSMFLEYTPAKRCLRKTKYDVIKLFLGKRSVYITYTDAQFIKRRDGELFVLLNGIRLCG